MKLEVCPGRDLLSSHLLGRVRGPQAESIDEHLANCESCLQTARDLETEDEFTSAMRANKVARVGSPSEIAAVIQRGKRLRTEIETTNSGDTLGESGRRRQTEFEQDETTQLEPIDFLNPAEQPDEIGRLGGYRVLEVLGIGGMGVVFRAEDPKLERLVALKAMKPAIAASKSAKDRFLREARAVAALEHDNIVPIYQVGEDRNIPFIAMQFLRGESLQSRLDRDSRLTPLQAVKIGREIATGLAAAHQRDLIHRDIKPDNIWIEEETGRAKILDFGLVLSVREDVGLTRTGMVLGTPRYMAPEQAQGQRVDHRGDLFSLGSMLYHLVSGAAPFDGGNLTATLNAVAYKEPRPIEQLCPDLDAGLAKLISQLLSKDIARRPQTAAAVAEALSEIEQRLESQPSNSTEPSVVQSPAVMPVNPILIAGVAATCAIGIFLMLWAFGVVFNVETHHGTIVVLLEGNTRGIEINVAENKTLTITDPNDGKTIKVSVDVEKHQLRLEKEGFESVLSSFSLKSPDGQRMKVSFTPKPVVVIDPELDPLPEDVPLLAEEKAADDWKPLDPATAARVRAVAEQIIRLEGAVAQPNERKIWNLEELPPGPLRITEVSFGGGARVQNEDLAMLASLPDLESVTFGRNSITDEGFASLAELPNLKHLYFITVGLGDQGLAALTRLPQLETLEIFHTEVTDDGLKVLSQMPSLRALILGVSRKRKFGPAYLSDAGLVHLPSLDKLSYLALAGPTFTDAGIEHLVKLRFVTKLSMGTQNVSEAGIKELRRRLPGCGVYDKRRVVEDDDDE